MASDITREEFEARVGVLEREVEGEKMVTRHILAETQLKRSSALWYASKVIHATQIIREQYVKEVNQGNMVAWAIRGLYGQPDEPIPADLRKRLDKIKDMSESDLTDLLAEVREQLGQREDLDHHKDIDISLQKMLAHLDPYTTYIDPDTLSRFQQDTTGKFKGIGISIRPKFARSG